MSTVSVRDRGGPDAVAGTAPWRQWARDHAALVGLALVLLVIATFTATQSSVFLTLGNLRNILLQSSVLAVVATAMTMLMVSGGIDLSAGSIMSLTAVSAATLSAAGVPLGVAIAGAVIGAIALGGINGALAAWSPSHPFIITLGTGIFIQGLAIQVTDGLPVSNLDPEFVAAGSGALLGIPNPIWVAAAVLLLVAALMRFTVFGRRLYAVGGNERASVLAGIRLRPTKVALYALAGLVFGIAGLVLSSRIASAQALMGNGYELQAIAAVAVGGTPLAGGRGGLLGTLLGVLLLGVISNSLNLLGVSGAVQYVLQGAVIVTAVMSQRIRS